METYQIIIDIVLVLSFALPLWGLVIWLAVREMSTEKRGKGLGEYGRKRFQESHEHRLGKEIADAGRQLGTMKIVMDEDGYEILVPREKE